MSKFTAGKLRRETPARVNVPSGEVRVLESHHATGFEMQLDQWPFHKICWVAVGRGQLESASGSSAIQRDDFLILPAGSSHRFIDDPDEPLTLVIVCIDQQLTQSARSILGIWKGALGGLDTSKPYCARSAFHKNALIEDFRRGLREQQNQETGWKNALMNVAQELIIRFARGHCIARDGFESDSLAAVNGAIEYLKLHFHEAQRIEDMAERCNLSPRRFTDLFRQQTGETFSNYLNARRIEYAKQRIQQTAHILYACHESGFNDLAYFYRVFKKHTGQTPGQYLNELAP